jgi:ATPase family associated with various cellular activities (AAA)
MFIKNKTKQNKTKNEMFWITLFFTVFVSNTTTLFQLLITVYFLFSQYRIFIITDKKRILSITKSITHSTFMDEQQNPSGFFIGKKCVGFIHYKEAPSHTTKELYILLKASDFADLCLTTYEQSIENRKSDAVTIWFRTGNFFWLDYERRSVIVFQEPRANQLAIIEQIESHYNQFERGVFFIYGEPGTGKSTMLGLLGKHFKTNICKKLKVTEPGDTLEILYNKVEPTKESPLIVLFDEIDGMIKKVHHHTITPHKHIPIEVYDTNSYNTFFDDIDDGFYPYLIVLLTSNKTREQIDREFLPCYLREGRVHGYFSLCQE